jgi:hypothetical protein
MSNVPPTSVYAHVKLDIGWPHLLLLVLALYVWNALICWIACTTEHLARDFHA